MTPNTIFECIKNEILFSNPKLVFLTEFNLSIHYPTCPRYPEKSADTDDDEASSTDSATEYSAIDTGDAENMYGGVHRQDQAYTVKWR